MNNARLGEPSVVRSALSSAFSRRFWCSAARGILSYYGRNVRWVTVHRQRLIHRLKIEAIVRSRGRVEEWMESRVKLWVGGRSLFRRIEKLIDRATHTIVVQMFIWKDDHLGQYIASLLVAAADRGVQVDVTKDAVGDSFELAQDFRSTREHRSGIWSRFWTHPNIAVHYGAYADHTKAFIFDGKVLLIGGMNIGEEYLHCRDYFVELRSRRFVQGFLTGEGAASPQESVVLVLNTPRHRDMRRHLTELLEGARKRILLEQCYLSDPAMADLLARRSREGVMVTIILPAKSDVHSHANLSFVSQLMARGDPGHVRVFLYPRMLHAKVVLVDRKRAFLGSTNLMTSSLDWMGEANVLINRWHFRALRTLRKAVRADLLQSRLLKNRPRLNWLQKMLAWCGL
jgi:cardiolipin synthase